MHLKTTLEVFVTAAAAGQQVEVTAVLVVARAGVHVKAVGGGSGDGRRRRECHVQRRGEQQAGGQFDHNIRSHFQYACHFVSNVCLSVHFVGVCLLFLLFI